MDFAATADNTTLQKPLVTRFAPSPTGYLHLGHVLSAMFVWGIGRALGARILLRIEDHDRGRSRHEFEQAIFADLAWLGFVYDNSELTPSSRSPYRQSDDWQRYADAIARLATKEQVYACDCTRRQIANLQASELSPNADDAELRYIGNCRERHLPLAASAVGLRVTMPPTTIRFDDLWLGPQQQDPWQQCGDMLLRDRHGCYTYQCAVVVDDLAQGVNLVIRGADLVASTGRQIWLARRLGREMDAQFLHHPLLRDDRGVKLGKRFLSEAVTQRRLRGEPPESVIGEAAWLGGLTPQPGALAVGELPELFRHVMVARSGSAKLGGAHE